MYKEHQKEKTPLLDIKKLDIIERVTIGDELHLMHYGIERKALQGWTYGLWGAIKWSPSTIEAISLDLVRIELPSEVHRKLRKLDDLKFWKASEYSSFLHYAAPVVLRGRISQDEYNHHMLFICAHIYSHIY